MKKVRTTDKFVKLLQKKNGRVTCLGCWASINGKIREVGEGPRSMRNVSSADIEFMKK